MEDAHSVVLSINEDPGYNFFGVYDGHGGNILPLLTRPHMEVATSHKP